MFSWVSCYCNFIQENTLPTFLKVQAVDLILLLSSSLQYSPNKQTIFGVFISTEAYPPMTEALRKGVKYV